MSALDKIECDFRLSYAAPAHEQNPHPINIDKRAMDDRLGIELIFEKIRNKKNNLGRLEFRNKNGNFPFVANIEQLPIELAATRNHNAGNCKTGKRRKRFNTVFQRKRSQIK